MERAPITRQRSSWEQLEEHDPRRGMYPACAWWRRRVSDGDLYACIAEEPLGWHLSISFRDHHSRLSRYPRWDEIANARDELLPADIEFVMFLPKSGEYVALHDTTFHLHEHPARNAVVL